MAQRRSDDKRPEGIAIKELYGRAVLRLLQMHYESGVGHIGGNLSALDLLLGLYHGTLQENDVFVLSKGHAVGALYVALWSIGVLTDDDLKSFHRDGTRLSGHPPIRCIPEILFATGSLGHGLGIAAGVAVAKRLKRELGRVFCLTSDGEWNEGSTWEALIFSVHRTLDNVTIIVDANGLQGFGSTHDVARLEPLEDKFRAFGVHTVVIDGHDARSIARALTLRSNCPVAIVAATIKGHGVSFMENRLEWHYLPLSTEQYEKAVLEVRQRCAMFSAAV